jgi:hypothetical protein
MRDIEALSLRDKVFGVVVAFSALFCVAVFFSLRLSGGRERFIIALAIFLVSFSFVKKKAGVGLGILAFIALRFIWAAIVLILQHC